jgi:hypothetical protein
MPHNVYTGDEGGRVVRSTLFPSSSSSSLFSGGKLGSTFDGGKGEKWYSRKLGFEGMVEKRGGMETGVVWGGVGDMGSGRRTSFQHGHGKVL